MLACRFPCLSLFPKLESFNFLPAGVFFAFVCLSYSIRVGVKAFLLIGSPHSVIPKDLWLRSLFKVYGSTSWAVNMNPTPALLRDLDLEEERQYVQVDHSPKAAPNKGSSTDFQNRQGRFCGRNQLCASWQVSSSFVLIIVSFNFQNGNDFTFQRLLVTHVCLFSRTTLTKYTN